MLETGVAIAVIVGIVEAIKRATGMPSKFAPLASIALGILAMVAFADFVVTAQDVFAGVIVGLSASGLYSGTRATVGK